MTLHELSGEIAGLFQRAREGVVCVQQHGAEGEAVSEASGTLWSRNGIVLTASHPFDDPGSIRVIHGSDEPVAARVRGWDNRYDLAVLEIPHSGLSAWRDWDELESVSPGEVVLSVGFEEIRMGIVSRMREEHLNRWGGALKPWVEVDGTLSRRQAGGPLVNDNGRFVGVNSTRPRPRGQTVGYGQLQNLVQAILTSGVPRPAYLGVRTAPAETSQRKRGLVVTHVEEASPAEKAGIATGDVLLELAGIRLTHPRRLFMALRGMNPGDRPELVAHRGDTETTITVELGERAQHHGRRF